MSNASRWYPLAKSHQDQQGSQREQLRTLVTFWGVACVSSSGVGYAENFRGGAKFRYSRVTSQINFRGSAEGTTILGGSRGMPSGKFCKITPKNKAFLCILETSFSTLLLRDLLAGETENWTFVVWG